ncbi:MAG: FMN-binding protein [Microbacterium sp. 67-17]|uniref:FMN-binding protein n=1 Tax=Microbacterium sp. 67-17 TaxID=1895782 RepID=UPI00095E357E|nr:FMN-binding protein [Microbacterium sp. 67-17]OJW01436.1 MAG: FMN-binding protein [Microbacterium sp. 67-17]
MKRIVYGLLATLSGVVLLFSYRTSLEAVMPVAADDTAGTTSSTTTAPAPASTPSSSAGAPDTAGTTTPSASPSPSPSTSTAQTTSGLADGTYTGDAVRTRYGNVQVQITVSGGAITDVQVPQYPSSNREDQQINARALPVLISETTSAQSASIRMVSGATYTSQGYTQSLQSALDQAQQ